MYTPIKLTATNFQSFASLDYDFQAGKAILIEGENRTDEGQKTNGAGKSSFNEMLHYLLIGSSSTGKRDIKLVRRGQKQATLSLLLHNEYLSHDLLIERTLFSNSKSSTLEIYINGESQKKRFATVVEGNKLILELLDISQEDLKNYFLINRKRFVSFFDSPDSAKRGLLARFASLDKVTETSKNIDTSIEGVQRGLNNIDRDLLSKRAQLEILEQELKEARSEYNPETEISSLKAQFNQCKERELSIAKELQTIRTQISEKSETIEQQERKLNHLNNRIKYLQGFDYQKALIDIEQEIERVRNQALSYKSSINENDKLITDLRKALEPMLVALEGAVTCPNCKTKFLVNDDSMTVEEIEEFKKEVNESIESLNVNSLELQKKIDSIEKGKQMETLFNEKKRVRHNAERRQALIQKVQALIQPYRYVVNTLLSEKEALLMKETRLRTETMSCISTEDALTERLEFLENNPQSFNDKKWTDKINPLKETIEQLQVKEETLNKELSNLTLWKTRYIQFYAHLTNKTLSIIQSRCNHHLEKIKSDLRLKFEGFKTLADGKLKESVNAVVMRGGTEEEDFRCFSGGECGRLIFSTIMAFQDLINEKSKSGGLDLLLIDEVLDQIDAEGLRLFIKALIPIKKTIFIVSQVKTESPVENTLLIVKENGISKIEQ